MEGVGSAYWSANPIFQTRRWSSRARATAWVRLVTPNLLYTSLIYHLTVPSARTSCAAISRLDKPSAISRRTSNSRSVKESGLAAPLNGASETCGSLTFVKSRMVRSRSRVLPRSQAASKTSDPN